MTEMNSQILPQLLSVQEFIEKMNSTVTSPIGAATIYRMVNQPGFPAVTIGNRRYVMIDRVRDWMMGQAAKEEAPKTYGEGKEYE